MQKLSVKALALSIGTFCALGALFLGLAAMCGWGEGCVKIMSSLYIGFEPTITGSLIGAVWAFVDGAIAGLIIALLYNAFTGKK